MRRDVEGRDLEEREEDPDERVVEDVGMLWSNDVEETLRKTGLGVVIEYNGMGYNSFSMEG